MITTERQRANAARQAEAFRKEIGALVADRSPDSSSKVILDGLRSQLEDVEREIAEYDTLRSGEVTELDLDKLSELPTLLIKARVATELTQKELAERIGVKEQQIQRYERQLYDGVSFSRVVEIAGALGLAVPGRVKVLSPKSRDAILERLSLLGVSRDLVEAKVAPTGGAATLAERLGHLFDWNPADVVEGTPLLLPSAAGATARFKLPKGRNERSVSAFTAYAHGLAKICAKAHEFGERSTIPIEATPMIELIKAKGGISFENALETAWDLGIVVLPLSGKGTFHGACWRISGVNVVVLKQTEQSAAKWLVDLMHEVFHAGRFPELDEFEVIEEPETSEVRREDREEVQATWFASLVASNMQAEDIFKATISRIGGDMRKLKQATIRAAADADLDVGVLANYFAYRLSLQGENWWGTAANLQDRTASPLFIARDAFLRRFDFSRTDEVGFELLKLALNDEVRHG